jgi:ribonuclease P protein component
VHLFLAVVTSKRLGGAVLRNRLRRRLREAVRTLLSRVQGDWAVMMLPREAAVHADFDRLRQAMEQLFRKGRIIDE